MSTAGSVEVYGWTARLSGSAQDPRSYRPQRVRGTGRAAFRRVTFVERRKGVGERTMDRRRSYIDIVERVLGNSLPLDQHHRPGTFLRDLSVGRSSFGSAISEIHVSILDGIDGPSH